MSQFYHWNNAEQSILSGIQPFVGQLSSKKSGKPNAEDGSSSDRTLQSGLYLTPLTYVVYVNFIHDLQFKADIERQIFLEKLFMTDLFALRVFARNLLRGSRRRNKYFFVFCFEVCPGARP